MRSITTRGAARLGVAAAFAAISTMGLTGIAQADSGQGVVGAVITGYLDQSVAPLPILESDGSDHPMYPSLIQLTAGDKTNPVNIDTYCIDIKTEVKGLDKYDEHAWDTNTVATSEANLNKIQWILNNAFPNLSASAFWSEVGSAAVSGLSPAQQERAAVAATQTAIWVYSDDAHLQTSQLTSSAYDKAIIAGYDYLTGSANVGAPQQPASLSITPSSASAAVTAGKVGPYTVTSNSTAPIAVSVSSTTSGVSLENSSGAAVSSVSSGGTFWVKLPAGASTAGNATISASTMSVLQIGRVFISEETGGMRSQRLITAKKTPTSAKASASALWTSAATPTPTPTPSATAPIGLAKTGASDTPMLVGIVVGLVVIGGGLLAFVRLRGRRAS
jgi:TQXA domain-containing protein